MHQPHNIANNQPDKYSLLFRKTLGLLGFFLPTLLILFSTIFYAMGVEDKVFQVSISHYYYSKLHIVFVGVLCLQAGFLTCYKGKKGSLDNLVSNFAGVFALLVAVFPTKLAGFEVIASLYINYFHSWMAVIHYISAFLLFVCFAIFCFFLFTISDIDIKKLNKEEKDKKNLRNRFYRTCGWIIVFSILPMLVIFTLEKLEIYYPINGLIKYSTFIFESIALMAFGVSWFLKSTLFWRKSGFKPLDIVMKYFR